MNGQCMVPSALTRFFFFRASLSAECWWQLLIQPHPAAVSLVDYARAFAVTCLLEAPIYQLGLYALKSERRQAVRWAGIIALNLATHPFIYFVVPRLVARAGGALYVSLLISESFAWLVEAYCFRRLARTTWWQGLLWSGAANLFSWWVGLLIL